MQWSLRAADLVLSGSTLTLAAGDAPAEGGVARGAGAGAGEAGA